jgi:hypothetical protein
MNNEYKILNEKLQFINKSLVFNEYYLNFFIHGLIRWV